MQYRLVNWAYATNWHWQESVWNRHLISQPNMMADTAIPRFFRDLQFSNVSEFPSSNIVDSLKDSSWIHWNFFFGSITHRQTCSPSPKISGLKIPQPPVFKRGTSHLGVNVIHHCATQRRTNAWNLIESFQICEMLHESTFICCPLK